MSISPVSALQAASIIVDPTVGHGNYTTITNATAAASSGQTILIKPGTYTENPALKAGVNYVAWSCDAYTPNVTINGKCTFSSAGTVSINGINLKTNSDYAIEVTGSAASVVNLINCRINCFNNTGIHFTSSNSASSINVLYSDLDINTTGISAFVHASAGTLLFQHSGSGNAGASVTPSTISSGQIGINFCAVSFPITTSGSVLFASSYNFYLTGQDVTALTHGATGAAASNFDQWSSGSASAISVGTGATFHLAQATVSSSNTNAITGLGTLMAGIITFTGTSSTINTSTVTKYTTYGGTIV